MNSALIFAALVFAAMPDPNAALLALQAKCHELSGVSDVSLKSISTDRGEMPVYLLTCSRPAPAMPPNPS